MVRLKEKAGDYKYINNEISIPYGAIKSNIDNRAVIISNKFQFLMVRLKVVSPLIQFFVSKISIPYGAIKRT
mgnify:CR=1 FL=1